MSQLSVFGILAAICVSVLAYFGGTQQLGAHPLWAYEVSIYGAVPGVMLALFLFWATRFAVYFAVFDLGLSGVVAWLGKRMFVASSGDNAFAGQMWFFGWIAVCACAVAVLALWAHAFAQSRAD